MQHELSRGAAAIEKGLGLFLGIVEDAGETPLSVQAGRAAIPISTAQRIVGAFVHTGLLSRVGRGRYAAGLRLAALAEQGANPRAVLAEASRPLLQRLARALSTTVHLAVLEGEMVTYLVKAHGGGPELLTRELIQLEAYCSGVGKVLLAHLDKAAREAYLAAGPFVALTPFTITDPAALRRELDAVRRQGFARDAAEVKENLHCVAVPVRGPDGQVVAALSVSGLPASRPSAPTPPFLPSLLACAQRIEARLGARPAPAVAAPSDAVA